MKKQRNRPRTVHKLQLKIHHVSKIRLVAILQQEVGVNRPMKFKKGKDVDKQAYAKHFHFSYNLVLDMERNETLNVV